MALVIGDADHLLGEPIIGKPREGQSLIYNGHSFVPATFVDQNQVETVRQSVMEAGHTAQQAMDRSIETRTLLEGFINENRLEIHPLEARLLETLRQNIHLLVLTSSKVHEESTQLMIDGFADSFASDSFIDWEVSEASYNSIEGSFSPIVAASGQKLKVSLDNTDQLELNDAQGEIKFWRQDHKRTGHFEGGENFFSAGSLVDRGGGRVSFPAVNHGLVAGDFVRFFGFLNSAYNAIHAVDPLTTEDEIVVVINFVAEQTGSNCGYRKIISMQVLCGNVCIEPGMEIEFQNSRQGIVSVNSASPCEGQITMDSEIPSQAIIGIKGILVGPQGLIVSSVRDHDGVSNNSIIDATPTVIDPGKVAFSSQTTSYEAYKVFDDGHGTNHRWLTARFDTTGWVSYDFGLGGKVINKYRWRTFENVSNAVPGVWKLEGSHNNIDWTSLHEGSNNNIAANTWIPVEAPGYFTFYNSQSYRYYRLNVTANCGHPEYLCLDEIELIESNEIVFPQSIMVACTKPAVFAESYDWSVIEKVEVTETKTAGSATFYALSFDSGQSWAVFRNGEWKKIASRETGSWQFQTDLETWESSPRNSQVSALKRALGESLNQMNGQEMAALLPSDWSKPGAWDVSTNSIQLAVGIRVDGDESPVVEGIQITFTGKAHDLKLESLPIEIGLGARNIQLSFLVKNYINSIRLYASVDGSPQWSEFENLSRRASLSNGIDFFVAGQFPVHENSQIRLKAECDSSAGTELHGWALSWD